MINLLVSLFGILFTIFFVIGTHEAAHFITARLLGIKVLRFSIGFGKTLTRWYDKKGTEYVLALIPLGGYVKMLDETEGPVPKEELHLAFNRQSFYKKFLVVVAGPLINIICAFLLYWLIFVIGFVTLKPVIGNVIPGSIAFEGGLKGEQEIISIDHKPTLTWMGVMFRLLSHTGDQDQLDIEVKSLTDKKADVRTLDLSDWQIDELTPDPLKSLGIVPYTPKIPLVIGVISANSPAELQGLNIGDKILAIDKKPITDWTELMTTIIKYPEKTLTFTLERKGNVIDIPIKIGAHRTLSLQQEGFLGIGPHFEWPKTLLNTIQYGPLEAIPHAFQEIVNFTYFNLLLLQKLITGKLSLFSLGGPITIFSSAGSALTYGLLAFINFLAFLSISIGIINLLPIPGLDGGHILIYVVEQMIGKPIPMPILLILYRLGFLLIIFILIQALVNDVLRLY